MAQAPTSSAAYEPGAARHLLIDGKWVPALSGKTMERINPASGCVVAHLAEGDAQDIDLAVAAARKAFEGPWRKFKPFDRQAVLLRLADLVEKNFEELSRSVTIDMGAPYTRALGQRQRIIGWLRYYAGLATAIHGETIENSVPGEVFSFATREPVGVVGSIIPWNGPLGAAIWKIGPVLATGCTMVLKPAEEGSLAPLRLGELLQEVGLPDGVVNIVTGRGEVAGAALAAHPDIDKVAFTGSHVAGQSIVKASAGNLKRLSLELGGKSPNIVFADADLDQAVPGSAMGVFSNSGQVCSAGTRLFVEESIYAKFIERLADYTRQLRIGDGLEPSTQIGPVVSRKQYDRVKQYLDIATAEGAEPVVGGGLATVPGLENGLFIQPTVFSKVDDRMTIAREEIFGPVVSTFSFRDIDEVARRANDTDFGLAAGIWTRDISKAHLLSRRIRAGVVWINCYGLGDPAVPFGGYKMSGYGRESGIQHVNEYLQVKSLWVKAA